MQLYNERKLSARQCKFVVLIVAPVAVVMWIDWLEVLKWVLIIFCSLLAIAVLIAWASPSTKTPVPPVKPPVKVNSLYDTLCFEALSEQGVCDRFIMLGGKASRMSRIYHIEFERLVPDLTHHLRVIELAKELTDVAKEYKESGEEAGNEQELVYFLKTVRAEYRALRGRMENVDKVLQERYKVASVL